MIEEPFTDAERTRLLRLALAEALAQVGDLALVNLIAKLTGTDTVLVARREYPAPQVELVVPDAGG
jgi:hypothetical protein